MPQRLDYSKLFKLQLMLADINTKSSLQRDIFEYFVDSILNGVNIPTSTIKVMTKEDLGLFGFKRFSLFSYVTNYLSVHYGFPNILYHLQVID